jgi:ribosomal protein S18 acetylase RimI-like enzyme
MNRSCPEYFACTVPRVTDASRAGSRLLAGLGDSRYDNREFLGEATNSSFRFEAALIEYRPFHNADPPQLADLWNFGKLGPGAALEFPNDALDMLVLAQPYFDREGLIVACEGSEVVGFIHAGFGANPAGTEVRADAGVICAVLVRLEYRRRGIGRELVARAENYLRGRGAREIYAGESELRNPFYLGLYGGAESAGLLASDTAAAPFFTALGYRPAERYILLRRDISQKNDPFDPRMVAVKRAMKFGVMDHPADADWWWMTRHGRFGSLTFVLVPNAGGPPPAEVTFWEMELHAATRGERTAGITGLKVVAGDRRKGYARALLTEVIRRLREELVTRVEVTIRDDNAAALQLFRSLNFEQFDTGVVYRKL